MSRVEEGAAWVQDYFGRGGAVAFNGGNPPEHGMQYPQAFLVEQEPNQIADPHFHLIDQFQVVVGGGGHMGKRPIHGVAIHYANAYTTYGPLAAGPEGVHYITMRNRWDTTLAHFMPKCRSELKPEPRRHFAGRPGDAGNRGSAGGDGVARLPVPARGGERWARRLALPHSGGAGGGWSDPAGGDGQYWLVLAGELAVGDATLTPMSCLFLDRGEAPLELLAGPGGVEMLGLQFPLRH